VIIYHLLRDQTAYRELGATYFDERERQDVERRSSAASKPSATPSPSRRTIRPLEDDVGARDVTFSEEDDRTTGNVSTTGDDHPNGVLDARMDDGRLHDDEAAYPEVVAGFLIRTRALFRRRTRRQ
jgi:hypothetical protein